jgi:predicted secreted protein
MSDIKFLSMKNMITEEVHEHDGYRSLMKQLADPEFRKKVDGDTLVIHRAGKPFIKVTIDNG